MSEVNTGASSLESNPGSNKQWSPASWRARPPSQSPVYADQAQLRAVEKRLSAYPPLVFEGEILRLKEQLARVERGEALLLQGGDCAESFSDLEFGTIRDTFRVLLQMAIVLTFGAKRPVVKVGRMAGQFAKPRSADLESRELPVSLPVALPVTLPAYRGDMINGYGFSEAERAPDPLRMEKAYFHSAATLNLLRSLAKGGFAGLDRIRDWNLKFLGGARPFASRYTELASRIEEAMAFLKAAGIGENSPDLSTIEFFTSHEALHLRYEEALVRARENARDFYSGSAHMLWIGERTRQLDGAHIEFARGIINPLGLKCGPEMKGEELLRLIDRLSPENEPGRLTIITRFGANKIAEKLPKLIRRVRGEGRRVVWCCDPMHGNTFVTGKGFKTRSFGDVMDETNRFFEIHESEGTIAGGVHFELTGKNVIECIGGSESHSEQSLTAVQYETLCDPRLNPSQALELAFGLVLRR